MTTQISVSKDGISISDKRLLKHVGDCRRPMEECLSTNENNQDRSLLSIQKLIQAGRLFLVISNYPWGVEFGIQQTEKAPSPIRKPE